MVDREKAELLDICFVSVFSQKEISAQYSASRRKETTRGQLTKISKEVVQGHLATLNAFKSTGIDELHPWVPWLPAEAISESVVYKL